VLGVSVSTVIRREHVLKSAIVNGVHMFDERVLRREVTTIPRVSGERRPFWRNPGVR
jgi:hypothetical protein